MYEISRILYKLGIPSTKQTKLNNVDIETYLGETETEETNKLSMKNSIKYCIMEHYTNRITIIIIM